MKLPGRLALLVAASLAVQSAAAVTLSNPTRIESVSIRDDLGVVRVEVLISNPPSNPAGCSDDTFIDIRLDAERSETELREMLNLLNLAFVSRRQVRFYLLDADDPDPCSSAGSSATIRVAVGLLAIY